MPPITVRNKKTGQTVTFDWNSSIDPSPMDIARSAAQQIPPADIRPGFGLNGPSPLDAPGARVPLSPQKGGGPQNQGSPAGSLADPINRAKVGMGDLDTQKSFSEQYPTLTGAIPSGLAGISRMLNTPIAQRLSQQSQQQIAGMDDPRPPMDGGQVAFKEGMRPSAGDDIRAAQGRGFRRGVNESVTPGHLLAAASLGAASPEAMVATNAPFIPSGVSRMLDPNESRGGRVMGGIEAAGGLAGTAAGLPGSMARIRQILGGGGAAGSELPPINQTYAPRVQIQPNRFDTPVIQPHVAPANNLPSIPQGVEPDIAASIEKELAPSIQNIIKQQYVEPQKQYIKDNATRPPVQDRQSAKIRAARSKDERDAMLAEERANREMYEAAQREQHSLEAATARLVSKQPPSQLKQVDAAITAEQRAAAGRRGQSARTDQHTTLQEQRADADWYKQQQAAEAARTNAADITSTQDELMGSDAAMEDAAHRAKALGLARTAVNENRMRETGGAPPRPVQAQAPQPMQPPVLENPTPVEAAAQADPTDTRWVQDQLNTLPDIAGQHEPDPRIQELMNSIDTDSPAGQTAAQKFRELVNGGVEPDEAFHFATTGELRPMNAQGPIPVAGPTSPTPGEVPAGPLPPQVEPVEPGLAGAQSMFTSADLPPADTRMADYLKQQPWFQALPADRRATLYKELGGLNAESRKIMPDPGESGMADPGAVLRMAGSASGAMLGAPVGYQQGETPRQKLLYGLLGGLGGAALGYGGVRGIEHLDSIGPDAALRNRMAQLHDDIRMSGMKRAGGGSTDAASEVGQAPFTGGPEAGRGGSEVAGDAPDSAGWGRSARAEAPSATFIGWQETMDGGKIPLFNVKGGPRHNSTVSANTLKEMGIPIPPTDPGGESGRIGMDLPATLWKSYPSLRAAVGGAAGSQVDDDHPYTGALLGAAAGVAAAPSADMGGLNALKWINRAQYESMLAGPAQLSNLLGNASTLLTTPVLEAARGNIRGGQNLMAEGVANPAAWRRAITQGFKAGFNEQRPQKYSGELPLGPSGRLLNAVDRSTKDIMESGGLTPEMTSHYTLTEDPVTDLGKGLQMIQRVPGVGMMTPFIRTLVKQMELGAAHSPLRHIVRNIDGSAPLADTFPVHNPLNVPHAALNPFEYTAMLPGTLAAYLGYKGVGSASPNVSAAYGGLAAPYNAARTFYDAKQFGNDSPSDIARSAAQQIPLASDLTGIIEDPTRIPGKIAQRFVPPSLMGVGDRTIREPRGDSAFDVEGYIQERLPWEREKLPIKPDFFGQPQQRNWFGGAPDPIYMRDPRAQALAQMGLLRRSQSPSMGSAQLTRQDQSDLQTSRGQKMMEVMGPYLDNPSRIQDFPNFLDSMPANQRAIMDEQVPQSVPRDKADIYRILQQQGINLGSLQFRLERLQRQAADLTPTP